MCIRDRSLGSLSLKVLTHISKASIIKGPTNKCHFLSEDKSCLLYTSFPTDNLEDTFLASIGEDNRRRGGTV